ncbi:hypothetical protein N7451_012651, partial [Penicillium sp. IBT 35674x]
PYRFDAYELEPPTGLSGIADPQIEQQSPLQTPKTPSSFQGHDAEGSWTWEIAGALVSVVCITLLIGFLVYVNGRTYSSWQYSISPNAVVSILAAFAKAATLRPISTCLGQFKWKRTWTSGLQQRPVRLSYYDMLDKASRDPWGSLEVLWRMPWSLPMAGALLMILSLALDPFSQQILASPSRQVVAQKKPLISKGPGVIGHGGLNEDYRLNEPDPLIKIALAQGLAQSNDPLKPICPTSNCLFPDFTTLGFCSQCVNVTESPTQSCISPKGVQATRYPWNSITSAYDQFRSNNIPRELVSILSAQYLNTITYNSSTPNVTEPRPMLNECYVHICEKQFTNVSYLPASAQAPIPSRSQRLIPADGLFAWEKDETLQLLPVNGSVTFSGTNYSVYATTRDSIIELLQGTFNATSFLAGGTTYQNYQRTAILILSNTSYTDVPTVFDTTATSMTDSIRTSSRSIHLQGTAYLCRPFVYQAFSIDNTSGVFKLTR